MSSSEFNLKWKSFFFYICFLIRFIYSNVNTNKQFSLFDIVLGTLTFNYSVFFFFTILCHPPKCKHSRERALTALKLITHKHTNWKCPVNWKICRHIKSIFCTNTADLATNNFITSNRHCSQFFTSYILFYFSVSLVLFVFSFSLSLLLAQINLPLIKPIFYYVVFSNFLDFVKCRKKK